MLSRHYGTSLPALMSQNLDSSAFTAPSSLLGLNPRASMIPPPPSAAAEEPVAPSDSANDGAQSSSFPAMQATSSSAASLHLMSSLESWIEPQNSGGSSAHSLAAIRRLPERVRASLDRHNTIVRRDTVNLEDVLEQLDLAEEGAPGAKKEEQRLDSLVSGPSASQQGVGEGPGSPFRSPFSSLPSRPLSESDRLCLEWRNSFIEDRGSLPSSSSLRVCSPRLGSRRSGPFFQASQISEEEPLIGASSLGSYGHQMRGQDASSLASHVPAGISIAEVLEMVSLTAKGNTNGCTANGGVRSPPKEASGKSNGRRSRVMTVDIGRLRQQLDPAIT